MAAPFDAIVEQLKQVLAQEQEQVQRARAAVESERERLQAESATLEASRVKVGVGSSALLACTKARRRGGATARGPQAHLLSGAPGRAIFVLDGGGRGPIPGGTSEAYPRGTSSAAGACLAHAPATKASVARRRSSARSLGPLCHPAARQYVCYRHGLPQVEAGDIIELNVGGRHLATTRRTLTLVRDSLLETMFRWARPGDSPAGGEVG